MLILRENASLTAYASGASASKRLAIVPTMGYLHQGHLSLIERAKSLADEVIVSIFVNPTQFGPHEDFERYPRNEAHDFALCEAAGVDAIFAPSSVAELYPAGEGVLWVDCPGLAAFHCGSSRPGHFRGVATVVAKLLLLSRAHYACFGEKDFQQLAIVRQLVSELFIPCEIVACPIVREPSGLALSSRNAMLSEGARAEASAIYRSLKRIQEAFEAGERRQSQLRKLALDTLSAVPSLDLEYLNFVSPTELSFLGEVFDTEVRVLIAARMETVRLIDNIHLAL